MCTACAGTACSNLDCKDLAPREPGAIQGKSAEDWSETPVLVLASCSFWQVLWVLSGGCFPCHGQQRCQLKVLQGDMPWHLPIPSSGSLAEFRGLAIKFRACP